jgi:hypothetical protein
MIPEGLHERDKRNKSFSAILSFQRLSRRICFPSKGMPLVVAQVTLTQNYEFDLSRLIQATVKPKKLMQAPSQVQR